MPERDTLEFTAAVVLGTLLGAGLTYLVRELDARGRPERLLSRERSGAGGAVDRVSREARSLGRELADAARDETAAFLAEAGKRILSGAVPWKDRS